VAFAGRVRRGRSGFCRFFAAFRAGDDFFFRAGALLGVFGFSVGVAVADLGGDEHLGEQHRPEALAQRAREDLTEVVERQRREALAEHLHQGEPLLVGERLLEVLTKLVEESHGDKVARDPGGSHPIVATSDGFPRPGTPDHRPPSPALPRS
jgi:hypothetical protein